MIESEVSRKEIFKMLATGDGFNYKMKILDQDLRAKIYRIFANYGIEKIGYDGVAEDPLAFIIERNGTFVGCAVVQLYWGQLHLKYLAIEKNFRRQGLGRILVDRCLDYGKKMGCDFVFVETMNFQALDFYIKMGFVLEFERKGYKSGVSSCYLQRKV